jgi:hypothetical protein
MKQEFDGEVAARTWLTTGMAVAGVLYGFAEPLSPERRVIAAGVGFMLGVFVGYFYDQTAFDQKRKKGK